MLCLYIYILSLYASSCMHCISIYTNSVNSFFCAIIRDSKSSPVTHQMGGMHLLRSQFKLLLSLCVTETELPVLRMWKRVLSGPSDVATKEFRDVIGHIPNPNYSILWFSKYIKFPSSISILWRLKFKGYLFVSAILHWQSLLFLIAEILSARVKKKKQY